MKIKRIIIIFLIFFFPYFLLAQTDHHEWIKEQNKYFTSFKKKHFKTQYHDKEDIKKEYLKMEYPSEHFEEIKKTFGKRNKLFSMIEELINRKKSNNT